MTLAEVFAEISQFYPSGQPFAFGHGAAAGRLAAEFGRALPAELAAYLDTYAPVEDVAFDTVGNPLRLYGLGSLGARQPGYNWNPLTQEPIADWPTGFFLLGDEGADPVLLDLDQPERYSEAVARRGRLGNWRHRGRYPGAVSAVQRGAAPRAARV